MRSHAIRRIPAKSNSCIYYRPEEQSRVEVHGDDFTGVGSKLEFKGFADELTKHCAFDIRGILTHSIVILNRWVTWASQGIKLEAGPRHV